jgi:arsenate reductase
VRFDETDDPLICFSKVYNAPPNPQAGFCAVMTCSQADKSCPLVQGSSLRVAIPYEDPKVADDTQKETAEYDKRCQQICREMLFVFSLL